MISIQIHVDERVMRGARRAGKTLKPSLFGLLVLALPLTLAAAPVSVPNTFQAGQPAKASEVNANFTALQMAVNDKDMRVGKLEASHPAPTAAGVYAYATTLDANATIGSTFNSSGGAVTVTGTTGDYSAVFANVTCVEANKPVGAAIVVPFNLSTAVNCRIANYVTLNNTDCQINVRCFDSNGSLRAGAISITYVH